MPHPSERLAALLSEPEPQLDRIMATVASIDPEASSEDAIAAEFDRLADGLDHDANGESTAATTPESTAASTAESTVTYVFGELGFVGNAARYYSPSNSLVHRVLSARRGIPLTLAAVAVEIGRRQGVDLSIVGLPGHVVLGDGGQPERWFDPFAGGAPLDLDGCRRLFARFHPVEAFDVSMVAPISTTSTTVRMLNNLKLAYRRLGDLGQMAKVLELSASMPGAAPTERVELAGVLAALGRDDQAAAQRDRLVTEDPERADSHRMAAHRHRSRRN